MPFRLSLYSSLMALSFLLAFPAQADFLESIEKEHEEMISILTNRHHSMIDSLKGEDVDPSYLALLDSQHQEMIALLDKQQKQRVDAWREIRNEPINERPNWQDINTSAPTREETDAPE